MRAITLRIKSSGGGFGPFHRGVVETPDVSLRALHEIRLLNEGSTVMLYEYAGDRGAAEELAADYLGSEDMEWETGRIDDNELMYAHAEPSGTVQALLRLLGEHHLVVDWPITFPEDEVAVVTLVGSDDVFREAFEDLPEELTVQVERTGDYQPELERLVACLTERERRTLLTAVELGYYRNPREANYQDIAEELDRSTGTVGLHLRNAEAKVMQELVSGMTGPEPSPSPLVQ